MQTSENVSVIDYGTATHHSKERIQNLTRKINNAQTPGTKIFYVSLITEI